MVGARDDDNRALVEFQMAKRKIREISGVKNRRNV